MNKNRKSIPKAFVLRLFTLTVLSLLFTSYSSQAQSHNLTIAQSSLADATVVLGQDFTIRICVTNDGQSSVDSFIIGETVGVGFELDPAKNPAWQIDENEATLLSANALAVQAKDSFDLVLTPVMGAPNDYGITYEIVEAYAAGQALVAESTTISTMQSSVYDLALTKQIVNGTPGAIGVRSEFEICVINQGNVDANDIEVVDYLGSGLFTRLSFTVNTDNDWFPPAGNILDTQFDSVFTVFESIPAGETVCKSIELAVIRTNEFDRGWDNRAEISKDDGDDFDSTPDKDSGNDAGGITNSDTDDTILNENGDEDDSDPAYMEIFDLALRKTILRTDVMEQYQYGDTITHMIEVFNQGNIAAKNIVITDSIPNGFEFLPMLNSGWTQGANGMYTYTISDTLPLFATDTILIRLLVLPSDEMRSYINYAYITSAENVNGEDRTPNDLDSTLGSNSFKENNVIGYPAYDPNFQADASIDDRINEDGKNSRGDEDDHDPALVEILDLAVVITNDNIIGNYGSLEPFDIIVQNQGSVPAQFNLALTVPAGFDFEESDNPDWSFDPVSSMATYKSMGTTDTIEVFDTDTITVLLEVLTGSSKDDWTVTVEISESSATEFDLSLTDVDSESDFDPNNDAGGAVLPDADSLNQVGSDDNLFGAGNGAVGSTDRANDEDDHDRELLGVFDLALRKTIMTPPPYEFGDTVTFEIEVFNQGSLQAKNVVVNDTAGMGLIFFMQDGWSASGSMYTSDPIDSIPSGTSQSILVDFIIGAPVGMNAYFNYAEISAAEDNAGQVLGVDFNDADSQPNSATPQEFAVLPGGPGDDNITSNSVDQVGSEDDHDPAFLEIFDLALIIEDDVNSIANYGESIPFTLTIYNQGTVPSTNPVIGVYPGDGFVFNPSDNLDWTPNGTNATIMLDTTLNGGDSVEVSIILTSEAVYAKNSYAPFAEILVDNPMSSTNVMKDGDSTPDSDPTNDAGAAAFPDSEDMILVGSDDIITGNGTGMPLDTVAMTDEDDSDREMVEVYDLAVRKTLNTPGSVKPGEEVQFDIEVINQGSVPATNVQIIDYIPDGLELAAIGNGIWTMSGTDAITMITDTIFGGCSLTVSIQLLVKSDADPSQVVNMVEISEAESLDGDLFSDFEADSTLDSDNTNDNGNEIYDDVNNDVVTGDAKNNPMDDEDDHDQEWVNICGGMVCSEPINFSLDEMCMGSVTIDMLIIGIAYPEQVYSIIATNRNTGEVRTGADFGYDDLGESFDVRICNEVCNNCCWTTVNVTDEFRPSITVENDTISCVQSPDEAREPAVTDNCNARAELLSTTFSRLSCDTSFVGVYERQWYAIDDLGNTSDTVTQMVFVSRTNLSGIQWPTNLIGSNGLTCSSYPTVDGFPDPAFTGVPVLNGVDLFPFDQASICNGFVTYDDLILNETPCGFTVERTWTVGEWWCSSSPMRIWRQRIDIQDDTNPVITGLPVEVTGQTLGTSCEAWVDLPAATISDLCSDISVISLSWSTGSISTNGGQAMIPIGIDTVTYTVIDICGNRSEAKVVVRTTDNISPVPLCDAFTTVSLTATGTATLTPEKVDDGSFDACSEVVDLSIQRTDAAGNIDPLAWANKITFECADVGELQMVALQVSDGMLSNTCMAQIEVQDKSRPAITCPSDTVDICTSTPDLMNLSSFYGSVDVTGTYCPNNADVEEFVDSDINNCGVGFIERRFELNFNSSVIQTCTQRIDVESIANSVTIKWPQDFTTNSFCRMTDLDPDNLDSIYAYPILEGGDCDLLGIHYDDQEFPFTTNGACQKVIRTWTVINWCRRVNGHVPTDTFEQVLVINNTVAPDITSDTELRSVCSYANDCEPTEIELLASADDDCTPVDELSWTWKIDLDQDGDTDVSGIGNDATGLYKIGRHSIEFTVADRCGSFATTSYEFEINNCKAPTAYCIVGLGTALIPMDLDTIPGPDAEMSMVTPDMFDNGSSHPCNIDLQLSFSADVNDTIKALSCDDLGMAPIELWVTDANGNTGKCVTFIEVIDSNNVEICVPVRNPRISGRLATELDDEIMDVQVQAVSQENYYFNTKEDGLYDFGELDKGLSYTVTPSKDEDYMNGISTADLILIQRHLLNMNTLDSPYKLIAADINRDDRVTAGDLVQLRKLILGVDARFNANTSWRFIDKGHEFADPTNPWATPFDESHYIDALSSDANIDFVGVKIGDINSDVVAGQINGKASPRGQAILYFEDQFLQQNESTTVDFTIGEDISLAGLQAYFKLSDFNVTNLSYKGQVLSEESWTYSNGILAVAIAEALEQDLIAGDGVISLELESTQSGLLTNRIELVDGQGELYDENVNTIAFEIASREANTVGYRLYQNEPNPFTETTLINFELPSAAKVLIEINDVNGSIIKTYNIKGNKGANSLRISDLGGSGVLYLTMTSGHFKETKKIVRIN